MIHKKIAVIGAGASGLTAAIAAGRCGADVIIFEKQKKAGRKLQATGNGRCNLSNRKLSSAHYHGENPHFVKSILSRFTVDDTVEFFRSLGVPLRELDDGRMYPWSLQARTVVEALLAGTESLRIPVHLHRRIDAVNAERNGFTLITAGKEKHRCDAVIMAMGGRSYASLGGSTRQYELAQSIGHTIIPQIPSILPINVPYTKLHTLQGIKWDCTLRAVSEGTCIAQSTGEVLFTQYGISGPASFDIAGVVNRAYSSGHEVRIEINFLPELNHEKSRDFIQQFCDERSVKQVLDGVFKYRIGDLLLHKTRLQPDRRAHDLSHGECEALIDVIKRCDVEVGAVRSFDEAAVSSGGICVDEINQQTLQSKIMPGVYVTGELLDIDGDCGGYNLQFAWATGTIAGTSAATPSS